MQTRQPDNERELMRSYLLGGLDGASLEQFELRLLSDARLRDELQDEQAELIDDYSFGLLSGGDRERFERHFLSVPGREPQVRFARAVKEYLGDEGERRRRRSALHASRSQRRPARRKLLAALALAACVSAAIGGVLLWQSARNAREARELSAQAEAVKEVLLWTRQPPVSVDARGRFADLTLTPGLRRESSEARRVVITGETLAAQFILELTDRRFESCEATLLNDEDVVIFSVNPLRAEDKGADRVLVLRVPSKFLPAGDYRLRVRCATAAGETAEAGTYPFQVIHRTVA